MFTKFRFLLLLCCSVVCATASAGSLMTVEEELAVAENIVGPIKNDDNCESCHALETEAWQNTRHFATFKDRHRSEEAKVILEAMGERSMKRADDCRQCHYTSEARDGNLRAAFGVTCESCHGAARPWLAIHSKQGGDAAADDLKWGTGKLEDAASRAKRLGAAQDKGMIHSDMIYDIAKNCFGCHTVPNESIVNDGGHVAGSEFDLVAWSQGEIRHNYSSSAGAPDDPTNREATAEHKRRLYITGLMVDLETSMENISRVEASGGMFHKAMVKRANDAVDRLKQVLAATSAPELKAGVEAVGTVTESTTVSPGTVEALSEATRAFLKSHDGSGLGGIDGLIPTDTVGDAY